jgi:hypothetical protein
MAEPFFKELKDIFGHTNYVFYISADGLGIHNKPANGLHAGDEELHIAFVELANVTCGCVCDEGVLLGTSDAGLYLLPWSVDFEAEEDLTAYLETYLSGVVDVDVYAVDKHNGVVATGSSSGTQVFRNGVEVFSDSIAAGISAIKLTDTNFAALTSAGSIVLHSYTDEDQFTEAPSMATPAESPATFSSKYFIDAMQEGVATVYTDYAARSGNYLCTVGSGQANLYREEADGSHTHLPQAVFQSQPFRDCAWSGDGVYLAIGRTDAPYIALFKRVGDVLTDISVDVGRVGAGYGVEWIGQVLLVGSSVAPTMASYTLSGDTLSENNTTGTARAYPLAINPTTGYIVTGSTASPYCHLWLWNGSNVSDEGFADTSPASGSVWTVLRHGDYFLVASTYLYVYKVVGGVLTFQYYYNQSGEVASMWSYQGYLIACSDTYAQIFVMTVGASAITKHSTFTINYLMHQTTYSPPVQACSPNEIVDCANGDLMVFFDYKPGSLRFNMTGTTIYSHYHQQISTSTVQTTSIAWGGIYAAVARSTEFTLHKQDGEVNLLNLGGYTPGGTISSLHWYGDYLAVTVSSSPYLKLYKRTGDTLNALSVPTMPGAGIRCRWSLNNLLFYRSGQTQLYIFTLTGDVLAAATPATVAIGSSLQDIDAIDTLVAVGHTASPYVTMLKWNGSSYDNLNFVGAGPSARLQFQDAGLLFTADYRVYPGIRYHSLKRGIETATGAVSSYMSAETLCRVGGCVVIGGYSWSNAGPGSVLCAIIYPATGVYAYASSKFIPLSAYRVTQMGGSTNSYLIFAMGTASWGYGPIYCKVFSDTYPAAAFAMDMQKELFFDQGTKLHRYNPETYINTEVTDVGGDVDDICLTEGAGGVFGAAAVATNAGINFVRLSEV